MLKVYTVHDAAAGAYLRPFFERSHGAAIRAFTDASLDPKHDFFKHARDFTLFYVGEFDDATGIVSGVTPHTPLGKALDYQTAGRSEDA